MQRNPIIAARFLCIVVSTVLLTLSPQVSKAQFPWSGKKLTADDYLAMVVQKIKEKDYKKAIALSYEGLENRPDYMDLHFMQGRAFMLYGNLDSARIKFKHVMTESPRYRDAYLLGTNLEIQMKNKEEARCVIDDGLYYFPFERDFMIKKIEVLDFCRDFKAADEYIEKLINVHYDDSIAMRYYFDYKFERAIYYTRLGNYAKALDCYSHILAYDPNNKAASEGRLNIEIKQGNMNEVMKQINSELVKNPRSYEFLTKKAILLSDQMHYAEALEVAEQLIKYFPGDSRARILHYEIQMASGRFYMKEDPYLVFQGILEKRPNDKEALAYTINLATAKGLHNEALVYENKAIAAYPNDQEFLKKKMGTLEYLQRYSEAALVAERLYRLNSNNREYRAQVIEYNILSGRQFLKEQEYDSAAVDFNTAIRLEPSNKEAILLLSETYLQQKKYEESLTVLDKGLNNNPDDVDYLYKRTVVLQEAGLLDLSASQAMAIQKQYPNEKRYQNLVVDVKTAHAKNLMSIDDYDGAREEYRTILRLQPNNWDALNGMINLESGTQRYDSALYYADLALLYYPDNRELLLKKSSVLESQKRYTDAYLITGNLRERYPYNSKIKQAYIEQRLASGIELNKQEKYDSALVEFNEVLAVSPRDSNALNYTCNILIEKQRYDSALNTANRGLYFYPENEQFLLKKAIILDKQNSYNEAVATADSLVRFYPTLRNIEFTDALKARAFRNEIGFMFLYSTFDSASNITRANIASIQYTRFTKWGSITGRLNMAGRNIGTGLQGEIDLNVKHGSKWYSFASGGISNEIVFPTIRLAYSLNHTFRKVYTLEAGIRYLRFDWLDVTMISGVIGLSRDWNEVWGNIRYYPIFQGNNIFHTVSSTLRMYITPSTEYVSAGFGIGNSPDEFSRNYILNENVRIRTYSFSMGYTKIFRHRNTFNVTGTWYNQALKSGYFRNQYDVLFVFLRKF